MEDGPSPKMHPLWRHVCLMPSRDVSVEERQRIESTLLEADPVPAELDAAQPSNDDKLMGEDDCIPPKR